MLKEWLLNNKDLAYLNSAIKPFDEQERKDKAKFMENYIIHNYKGPEKYISIQDKCLPNEDPEYLSKKDLVEGDLYSCYDDQHIDLKVADNSEYVGCISLVSLQNYKTLDNYWYICCNKDFTKVAVLNKVDLVNIINMNHINTDPFLSGKDIENIVKENKLRFSLLEAK